VKLIVHRTLLEVFFRSGFDQSRAATGRQKDRSFLTPQCLPIDLNSFIVGHAERAPDGWQLFSWRCGNVRGRGAEPPRSVTPAAPLARSGRRTPMGRKAALRHEGPTHEFH